MPLVHGAAIALDARPRDGVTGSEGTVGVGYGVWEEEAVTNQNPSEQRVQLGGGVSYFGWILT